MLISNFTAVLRYIALSRRRCGGGLNYHKAVNVLLVLLPLKYSKMLISKYGSNGFCMFHLLFGFLIILLIYQWKTKYKHFNDGFQKCAENLFFPFKLLSWQLQRCLLESCQTVLGFVTVFKRYSKGIKSFKIDS